MDAAIILTDLKLNLHKNIDSNFVLYQGKRLLKELEKNGEMDAREFVNDIRYFYKKYESYLNVYRDAYESVTPHLRINSSEYFFWPLVCGSAEKINCLFTKKTNDADSLFNEH